MWGMLGLTKLDGASNVCILETSTTVISLLPVTFWKAITLLVIDLLV